jgi:hypothetical protein
MSPTAAASFCAYGANSNPAAATASGLLSGWHHKCCPATRASSQGAGPIGTSLCGVQGDTQWSIRPWANTGDVLNVLIVYMSGLHAGSCVLLCNNVLLICWIRASPDRPVWDPNKAQGGDTPETVRKTVSPVGNFTHTHRQ